jgi:uncharacterized protein YkwD
MVGTMPRARRLDRLVLLTGLATAASLAIGFAGTPNASASACGKWGDAEPGSISNGEARKAVHCLINKERDRAGLKNLDRDKRLQRAAQRHTDEMDGTGCFDHTCGGEGALDNRLEDVGYLVGGLSRWAFGENIAWGMRGRGTPKAIVDAWMRSAGHRANILNRDFRELGIGFAVGTPGAGNEPGGLYTADFGLRVG